MGCTGNLQRNKPRTDNNELYNEEEDFYNAHKSRLY